MKPETRIGLLVGLMFIILFGLVLSGLTGGTEPTTPPHSERQRTDLTYAWTPVPERSTDERSDARDASEAASSRAERPAGVVEATWTRPRDSRGGEVNVAMRRQEVIPPMPAVARQRSRQRREQAASDGPMPVAAEASRVEPPPVAAPAARTYTVEPGDSLIRIATKVYGRDHADEYKRIYAANRDRISDEHTVVVGQTLAIPPLDEAASTARPAPRQRPAPTRRRVEELDVEQLRRRFARRPAAPSRRRVYTVRRGDNLTKIAREVLQDDSRSAVRKLYEANRDKLSSPDTLPVGLELEIPDSI